MPKRIILSFTARPNQANHDTLKDEIRGLKREIENLEDGSAKRLKMTEDCLSYELDLNINELERTNIQLKMNSITKRQAVQFNEQLWDQRINLNGLRFRASVDLYNSELPDMKEMNIRSNQNRMNARLAVNLYFTKTNQKPCTGLEKVPNRKNDLTQRKFRTELIDAYNSRDPTDPTFLWCPVLRDYFDPSLMTAAHLMPYAMPDKFIEEVCGPGSSLYKMTPENGLMLNFRVEKAFDMGHMKLPFP
ncbi:uncharacterized protein Z519_04327 [Cladophialophora bantiana CBS 173.52]|uniref:HNH nuclease domain-containing protein n=1 Tax=Cladophialophora bantiana (strain ATCC 10958 / CBS 173.52 / CDC B-1940 / NIH 8579) TaxID=1442370 RepID=A0A0D2GAY0_CLAB1|nr:uncharacterized protein Z519_04327 [Cladophialophora bantiana CBS 173.52]KIW95742.1 hypothetical protein Z519_04327 [Cladophialophora bantiana CBS 173.52]